MKKLLGIIFVILMNTSLASMSLAGQTTATAIQPRTAIRNAPVLVSTHRIPKFKLLRGNPHRVAHFITNDDDDGIDDEGIITSYRRRDLQKIEHEDSISEHVRWRLFLARQIALLKYKAKFG